MTFDFDHRSRSFWIDVAVAPEAAPLSGDRIGAADGMPLDSPVVAPLAQVEDKR
jgi:hypothetical protein